jgi:hypothetical protein
MSAATFEGFLVCLIPEIKVPDVITIELECKPAVALFVNKRRYRETVRLCWQLAKNVISLKLPLRFKTIWSALVQQFKILVRVEVLIDYSICF